MGHHDTSDCGVCSSRYGLTREECLELLGITEETAVNNTARSAAYARQNGTETLTPKQRRRALKKASRTHLQGEHGPEIVNFGSSEFTIPVKIDVEAVKAKVGIITYTGYVDHVDGTFHYETKAGVAKVAKKFTVLPD